MACKYENHPYPPCRFEQHPSNENVYFCPHCRESYNVRDIEKKPLLSLWLLFLIGALVWSLMNTEPKPASLRKDNSNNSNVSVQIE
ncbi:hypothetical protein NIES4071_50900 [Calothrix sp. NIES-4071]|nr:hypothetical protein NIES4071_50900 [Calothrix sp. NIES-4071]BAZ59398.1 hypothetical protein NIES4105_50850 [Calothrix sp. NIES-4105]